MAGIVQLAVEMVAAVGENDLKIELRCTRGQFVNSDVELGQGDLGGSSALHHQHDLEQRCLALCEGFDEYVVRHFGVLQGRHVDVPDAGENFTEGESPVENRPQHHRVDEHSDDVVEGALATPGHRGADRDVVRSTFSTEQDGQRGVDHHEHADVASRRDLADPAVRRGVDPEIEISTAQRDTCRPRVIHRQFRELTAFGERVRPEPQLLGENRIRVGRFAERSSLPFAEIAVLHFERQPRRYTPARPRRVSDHHVTSQRRHRQAVRCNVVNDEDQGVLAFVHLEQSGADRHRFADVESRSCQFARPRCGRCGRHRFHLEMIEHLVHTENVLDRTTGALGENGPQDLVPNDHVPQCGEQCVDVEIAGHRNRDRNVVRRRTRIELIGQPHTLLSQRYRYPVRAIDTRQCWGARVPRVREVCASSQSGDGRRLEEVENAQRRPECSVDPRHDSGRDQRVTAEVEETVVCSRPGDAEQIAEHRRNSLLGRGLGGTVFGRAARRIDVR